MVEFVWFTFFSSMAYVAMLVMMFSLFKLQFKGYANQILLTTLLLCYVSYTMRLQNLEAYTTVAQYILFFLLVWLLFRIQVFYALISSFVAFFGYGFLQTLIVFIGFKLKWWSPELTRGDLHVIEATTAIIYMTIAWIIRQRRRGFNFVPTSMNARVKYSKLNIAFLIVIPLAMLATTILLFATTISDSGNNIYYAILLGLSIILVLRLAHAKEWEDIDD